MNRTDRRRARRAARGASPLFRHALVTVTECCCDGYPCPFCSAITAPSEDGIWRCLCGWSGVLVADV